jgi:hypothetical protein
MDDLKIYFFGSIWGAKADNEIVQGLLKYLKTKGNVLSEYLFSKEYRENEKLSAREIHDRDLKWIKESDIMAGDVTAASLGVGYELRHGVILAKPILCLYRPQEGKNLSAMIDGSPGIIVRRYQRLEEAEELIDDFLAQIRTSKRFRTNFFMTG